MQQHSFSPVVSINKASLPRRKHQIIETTNEKKGSLSVLPTVAVFQSFLRFLHIWCLINKWFKRNSLFIDIYAVWKHSLWRLFIDIYAVYLEAFTLTVSDYQNFQPSNLKLSVKEYRLFTFLKNVSFCTLSPTFVII